MKYLGTIKPDKLFGLLNIVGVPFTALYVICMFIYPWFDGGGNWAHVQSVWDRWQGFNVGMLAFISSIAAFNISKFNAEKQRERDFLSAKAFLPAALSELVSYFRSSAVLFRAGWGLGGGGRPAIVAPELPVTYREVFGNCIKHAEPIVGDYLSRMLVNLQVHDARLRDYIHQFRDENVPILDKQNLITYFYRLGELQALTNKLFGFARSEEEFDSDPLVWDDFRNAYLNLGIWINEIHIDENMNLEAFTRRRLAREGLQED